MEEQTHQDGGTTEHVEPLPTPEPTPAPERTQAELDELWKAKIKRLEINCQTLELITARKKLDYQAAEKSLKAAVVELRMKIAQVGEEDQLALPLEDKGDEAPGDAADPPVQDAGDMDPSKMERRGIPLDPEYQKPANVHDIKAPGHPSTPRGDLEL